MPDSLERLHSLSGNLRVWLGLTEAFARRVERHRPCISKRFEIGQPSLGAGYAFGDYNEKSALTGVRHGGDNDCVAGTGETGCVYPVMYRRKCRDEPPEFGDSLDRLEKRWQ